MKDVNLKATKLMNLIGFIHKEKQLPKRQKDKELFMFYTTLQQAAKIAKDKENNGRFLNQTELENLYYYMLVEDAISKYKLTKKQKVEILIEYIEKNHHLPRRNKNNQKERVKYSDGTDMTSVLKQVMNISQEAIKKQNQNQKLSSLELINLEYRKLIYEALSKYKMTRKEKVEALIEFIKQHHRLPRPKQFNKEKREASFKDNTDMSNFYEALQEKRNKIIKDKGKNESFTTKEQEIIDDYDKIQETLRSVKMKKEEKEKELLMFIHNHHRLPRAKEALLSNGKDMRNFYNSIEHSVKYSNQKQLNNQPLTKTRQKDLECYNRIQKTLSLYKMDTQNKEETNLTEIEKIMNYLELLRTTNSYEEIILLCETIIENKNLNEVEEQKLRNVFQKYIKQVYHLEEKEKKLNKELGSLA